MGSRYRLARRPKLTDRIWNSSGWACRARCCAAAARKTTAMGVAWSKFSFLESPWLRLFDLLLYAIKILDNTKILAPMMLDTK